MKIQLLKNQEKKAINENAIKEPNSEEVATPPRDFSPTNTNENTNDGFYDQDDVTENSRSPTPEVNLAKENTLTMDEIKDHIKKVKDDLGDLLEEEDSSDENVFETIDPNMYTEHKNSKKIIGSKENSDIQNGVTGVNNDITNDDSDENNEILNKDTEDNIRSNNYDENNDMATDDLEDDKSLTEDSIAEVNAVAINDYEKNEVENTEFVTSSQLAKSNVDGLSGSITSDCSSVSSIICDVPTDHYEVNDNLTVDMFDFKIPEHLSIEPKSSRELFQLKKRFKCPECPRRFLNMKYLKIHEKSCAAPADSPYKCTVCDRKFMDFDLLQKHWKINHNRQQMI